MVRILRHKWRSFSAKFRKMSTVDAEVLLLCSSSLSVSQSCLPPDNLASGALNIRSNHIYEQFSLLAVRGSSRKNLVLRRVEWTLKVGPQPRCLKVVFAARFFKRFAPQDSVSNARPKTHKRIPARSKSRYSVRRWSVGAVR